MCDKVAIQHEVLLNPIMIQTSTLLCYNTYLYIYIYAVPHWLLIYFDETDLSQKWSYFVRTVIMYSNH